MKVFGLVSNMKIDIIKNFGLLQIAHFCIYVAGSLDDIR